MSILSQAMRGLSGAVVDVANDTLAELRQKRLMEAQQNYQSSENDKSREMQKEQMQQANNQFETNKQLTREQMAQTKDYQDKTLGQHSTEFAAQQANVKIGNDRNAHSDELNEASLAYAGAAAGIQSLTAELSKVKDQQPRQNANGDLLDQPSEFNAWKKQRIDELTAQLKSENERIKPVLDDLDKRYSKYNHIFGSKIARDEPPTLLKRPLY